MSESIGPSNSVGIANGLHVPIGSDVVRLRQQSGAVRAGQDFDQA